MNVILRNEMTSAMYTLEPGWGPNPVYEAACAYLEAAEDVMLKETKRNAKWLYVPNWFVCHHLSVIASELFLKSFHVTVSYDAMNEEGPIDEKYQHAYMGHRANLDKLPQDVSDNLKRHLSDKLFCLMKGLSNKDITIGRYPYEANDLFPSGDTGQNLAAEWLDLAQELRKYGKIGKPFIE